MDKYRRGFTIIELIVVIAIISVLASIVASSVNTIRSKANDAKRIAGVKQLMTALELYYSQNGHYPISGSCDATIPNSGWCNSVQSLSGSHWIHDAGVENALSPFISGEITDPKQGSLPAVWNSRGIFYFGRGYGGSGKWYMIVFKLENYPHSLEAQDGVTACDDRYFHYGSGSNGVITIGKNCVR